MVSHCLKSPDKVSTNCRKALPDWEQMSSWPQAALLEWYLYDVLLDDLPLWDDDVLWRALLTAQPCEGAAPGQGERAAERHLHGLPTRHLPPLPRLSLQTLDSLEKTQQWGSEVNGSEPKKQKGLDVCHALSLTTMTQSWWLKLQPRTLWSSSLGLCLRYKSA